MEERIKESLNALMDAIRRADAVGISSEMALLERCLAEGRSTLHPQLVHFLEKRSYPKALAFLEGATDVPAGVCRPRR
ncbi:MAG TPA: hypothetical protein VGF85_10095 [Opitutaceae bacterium]|jgi:hypothetical protein